MSRCVTSTDGVEIALHHLGGNGEPLVLAHATGFHAMVWRPLAAQLTGFDCWAPDLRGHGDSTAPTDGNFAWNGFADDVLAVVDALGVGPMAGVGHSKGGAALLLAEQRRPGTFSALYLYEPVVFPPDIFSDPLGMAAPVDNPLAEGALRRRECFASRDDAFANFAGKPPFNSLHPDALRAYVEHGFADRPDGTVRLKCRPTHEAEIYRTGGSHDAFDHLDAVECPVTVARGAMVEWGPAAFAQRIAGELPHGRLLTFDQLGHFGPLEDPALIAESIMETLRPA